MTDKPQPFLGSIGGIIAGSVIKGAVDKALEKIADSPNTRLQPADVPATKAIVTAEIEKELAPRVIHKANQEPAYQSRVTIGSVMAVVGAVVGIYQLWDNGRADGWEAYSPHIGVIAGGLFALYGRWVAKKPLGE